MLRIGYRGIPRTAGHPTTSCAPPLAGPSSDYRRLRVTQKLHDRVRKIMPRQLPAAGAFRDKSGPRQPADLVRGADQHAVKFVAVLGNTRPCETFSSHGFDEPSAEATAELVMIGLPSRRTVESQMSRWRITNNAFQKQDEFFAGDRCQTPCSLLRRRDQLSEQNMNVNSWRP